MSATQSARIAPSPSELRRHWPLVLAASLGVMVSFASIFIYSFSVLLKPLSSEFGWTRGEVSAGYSVAALTLAFASPFIGRIADRIGVRPVIVVCCAIFGISFASLATLKGQLWQFYGIMFVLGMFGNGTTQLTWARAIASRFDARRGMALAIMMMGGGIGSIIVPWMTSRMVADSGWRSVYLLLGVVAFAVGPVLALLALRNPQAERFQKRGPTRGTSALGNPVFRVLLAGFFLVALGANGCVAHLAALLTDRGFEVSTAAGVVSVLGVASVTGRLLAGVLIDRYFAARVGFYFVAASAVGILMLIFTKGSFTAGLAAALLGLAIGAEADVFPYLISRYMGLSSFSELYGYAFSAYAVGGSMGPLLMGLAHDRTQTYTMPLIGGALTTAIAAALLLTLPRYGSIHPPVIEAEAKIDG